MEAEKQKAPGLKTGAAPGPVSNSPLGGDADNDKAHNSRAHGEREQNGTTDDAGLAGDATAPTATDQG